MRQVHHSNGGRRILMLLDKPLPGDPRVSKEAFTLTEHGYRVRVISLDPKLRGRKVIRGVVVYFLPMRTFMRKAARARSRLGQLVLRLRSVIGYILEYAYFGVVCLMVAPIVAVRDGFDVIHLHNPPNVAAFVPILYRALGKKFVFDHHDLEPELFLSRFRSSRGWLHRILIGIEALCIRHADLVLATNESYKAIEIARGGIEEQKVFVVRNGPDLRAWGIDSRHVHVPDPHLKKLVYLGTMGPQDGVDYLLRAIYELLHGLHRNDFRCVIIGTGDSVPDLMSYSRELGLDGFVEFTGFIPLADLIEHLKSADICLDPNPSSPLNDQSTWVKVMEYMAFAKPTVSFALKETRVTAGEAALYVTPNRVDEYARALAALMDDSERRRRMGDIAYRRIKEELSWEHVSKRLIAGYEWLRSRNRQTAAVQSAWGNPPTAALPLSTRLFYAVRPLVPRRVALSARRIWVLKKRRHHWQRWPIDEGAGLVPPRWPGWPDGKRFALVLTHDVERNHGQSKVLRLADLERRLGFRSLFAFVPCRYPLDGTIVASLRQEGFEIGVHGLKHDGMLYRSRRVFQRRSVLINEYLRKWHAVGFRSPAMHHNLDWLHQLHVEYDSSTFDTDPFEPQPDGVGTIFPFWVPNPSDPKRGYVELPYTVAQDFTLFVLMRERNTDLWMKKVRWIVESGGMVLVNTHPDYMCLDGKRPRYDQYPVDWYRSFLEDVAREFAGQFWHTLPREVAAYVRAVSCGPDKPVVSRPNGANAHELRR